jgi:hypothetical protein
MRDIEIACQDGETYPYVAIDCGTNSVMFRHDVGAENTLSQTAVEHCVRHGGRACLSYGLVVFSAIGHGLCGKRSKSGAVKRLRID